MTPDLLTRFRRAALATTAGLLSVASACSGGAAHSGGQDAAGGGSGGMAAGGSSRADSSAAGGGAGGALAGGAGGQGTQKGSGGVGGNPRDAGTTADQAMDSPPAARAEQACRDAIVAQCERRTICLGGSYSDCARVADRCPDYYFGRGSLRTVENVEACIPLVRQATCTDLAMGLHWDCLVGGLAAAGDPCGSSSECASGACKGAYPTCGTCVASSAIGGACDPNTPCAAGGVCNPGSRTCVAGPVTYAAAGQACDIGGNPPIGCEGDLICVPTASSGTAGTCTPLPTQGGKCLEAISGFFRTATCAPGFSCGIDRSDGLRTARCGNPAPCGTTVCDANSYCYETPDVFNICQSYSKPGEACNSANYGEHLCAAGAICVTATGDAGDQGTCMAIVEVGLGEACSTTATCKSPYFCQAGRCASFDPASCLQLADAGR